LRASRHRKRRAVVIRPDLTGQRDRVVRLAERGYAVIGDVLDPATVLAPVLDAMARHLGPWAREQVSRLEEADDIDIITVWIPLVDLTETTGCLQVIPTRREHALFLHCPGRAGVAIPAGRLPGGAQVPVPMHRGSVLLMHSRTVHSSMPNVTPDRVRLSLDLRYQSVPAPTGRPAFPSLLLRGKRPGSQPTDWESWCAAWLGTRDRLADQELGKLNRWDPGHPRDRELPGIHGRDLASVKPAFADATAHRHEEGTT
jgi:Phytanoyl-CoA dioxygenase (PhyH)